MEKWVLAIDYDKEKFNAAQRECLKYGVFIRVAANFTEAISELSKGNDYLLIAIFSDVAICLTNLKLIRSLTKAPILVLKHQYDGAEKVAAIEMGADEYIQWPDTIPEGVASCRALIRRYTELNRQEQRQLNILARGSIFISVDYHKVFINAQEVELPRREFDLFYLLASNPGRVFTQEQLYEQIWNGEYVPTENSLHSCLRRIRRKLEARRARPARYRIRGAWGTAFCKMNHESATSGLILEVKPLLRRNLRYLLIS